MREKTGVCQRLLAYLPFAAIQHYFHVRFASPVMVNSAIVAGFYLAEFGGKLRLN
jgi:hypothetical protein